MDTRRPQYGSLLTAAGGIVLAVAVFLPWYGLALTASGLARAQSIGEQFVARYGNAALQNDLSNFYNTDLGGFAGREVVALSAHQVLHTLNVVLLVLAGLAIASSLLALAGGSAAAAVGLGEAPSALLGALAALCVGYRMIVPPVPTAGLLSISLREGAWLALLGALAMIAGALWPAARGRASTSSAAASKAALSQLSGWTP